MAVQSVATQTPAPRALDVALVAERLEEAIAVQELAARVNIENEEDSEMLQAAARVTMRLLEEAHREVCGG